MKGYGGGRCGGDSGLQPRIFRTRTGGLVLASLEMMLHRWMDWAGNDISTVTLDLFIVTYY